MLLRRALAVGRAGGSVGRDGRVQRESGGGLVLGTRLERRRRGALVRQRLRWPLSLRTLRVLGASILLELRNASRKKSAKGKMAMYIEYMCTRIMMHKNNSK